MSSEAYQELADFNKDYLRSDRFAAGVLVLQITNEVCRYMKKKRITRKELANRLGVPVSKVNKFLNSDKKLSVLTLARILRVLEADFDFRIKDKETYPVPVKVEE